MSQEAKAKKAKDVTDTFRKGTVERTWKAPNSERSYLLRFIPDLNADESEARFSVAFHLPVEEEGDEEEDAYGNVVGRKKELSVFGGVWTSDAEHAFVGFWSEGDDGCEFFVKDDFIHRSELDAVTTALTAELSPPLIDSFDDGSGGDRDGIAAPAFVFDNMSISQLYQ
jgi:hypothetical protein